jgi:hypothetical protein
MKTMNLTQPLLLRDGQLNILCLDEIKAYLEGLKG